jgi:hypothetical protein
MRGQIASQATTPWTLLEAGWNCNHSKDLVRILRDGGTLAGDRTQSLRLQVGNPYDWCIEACTMVKHVLTCAAYRSPRACTHSPVVGWHRTGRPAAVRRLFFHHRVCACAAQGCEPTQELAVPR